jgi:cytochrome bd-type quinol oxidase subunit 1
MIFIHSLLRYAVILLVLVAFLVNLRGWLMQRPIIIWERMATIWAMIICHIQLVFGIVLYATNAAAFHSNDAGAWQNYIMHVHIGSMVLAIALVTAGRMLSKRAQDERRKQMLIAIPYGIALALMLYATPWPLTEIGRTFGKGWL